MLPVAWVLWEVLFCDQYGFYNLILNKLIGANGWNPDVIVVCKEY